MPLSPNIVSKILDVVNPAYVHEAKMLLSGRQRWKKTRDLFEALSKIVAGAASMVAFAASSLKDPTLSDWLSFASGCMGTTSLVMLLFAQYSAKTSRSRTRELNEILDRARITPMPQIATEPDRDGDAEDGVEQHQIRVAIDSVQQRIDALQTQMSGSTSGAPSPVQS